MSIPGHFEIWGNRGFLEFYRRNNDDDLFLIKEISVFTSMIGSKLLSERTDVFPKYFLGVLSTQLDSCMCVYVKATVAEENTQKQREMCTKCCAIV